MMRRRYDDVICDEADEMEEVLTADAPSKLSQLMKTSQLLIHSAFFKARIALGHAKVTKCRSPVDKGSIVKDAKTLVNDYIDDRLTRSGLNMKGRKVTLSSYQMLKENPETLTMNTTEQQHTEKRNGRKETDDGSHCIDEITKVLICVGEYLEIRHNGLYTDILQQLDVRSIVETNLYRLFMSVARELFQTGITWAKIVSLFAFAGGLATDCVLGGSPMHVAHIKSWATEFITTELIEWIHTEGGWLTMCEHFMCDRDGHTSVRLFYWMFSALILVVSVIFTATSFVHYKKV